MILGRSFGGPAGGSLVTLGNSWRRPSSDLPTLAVGLVEDGVRRGVPARLHRGRVPVDRLAGPQRGDAEQDDLGQPGAVREVRPGGVGGLDRVDPVAVVT